MGEWTDAVEAKARIIRGQLAVARAIAKRSGASVGDIARPYLDLLTGLYREELVLARLADASYVALRDDRA